MYYWGSDINFVLQKYIFFISDMIFKVSSFTTEEVDELRSKILNVLAQMQFCVQKMEKVTTPLGKSIIKDLIFLGKSTNLAFSIAHLK